MRTLDPSRELQILDSAAQLFARHRYHEVRMEDIAAHAGVAKGTLYRYFQDKEDLYLALTMHGMQQLYEESKNRLTGPDAPEDKLLAFITGLVRFYEKYPYFLELIARLETSPSQASMNALESLQQKYYQLLGGLMAEIGETGRYHLGDPHLATLALIGIIRGILRFFPQPWPAGLSSWMYHQFLHGLAGNK